MKAKRTEFHRGDWGQLPGKGDLSVYTQGTVVQSPQGRGSPKGPGMGGVRGRCVLP